MATAKIVARSFGNKKVEVRYPPPESGPRLSVAHRRPGGPAGKRLTKMLAIYGVIATWTRDFLGKSGQCARIVMNS